MLPLLPLAHATTWVVDQTGAGDATTVAEGAALMSDGDTLYIKEGVYHEADINILEQGVTILGDGPDRTILDGAELDGNDLLAVRFADVTGIGFRNLQSSYSGGLGAGALADEYTYLHVDHCAFTNLQNGIGDSVTNELTITDSTFTDNTTAVLLYGGVYTFTVENSLFLGNTQTFSTNDPSWGPGGLSWLIAYNLFLDEGDGVTITQGGEDFASGFEVRIDNNIVSGGTTGIVIDTSTAADFVSGTVTHNLLDDDYRDPAHADEAWMVISDNPIGDPTFLDFSDDGDWTNDDLRLAWGSLGLDAGTDSFFGWDVVDADGVFRPLDADGDGVALPDIGPYEKNPDGDADGYATTEAGGPDCDDTDATVNPAAADLCGDGLDQDCSGADTPCDTGTAPDSGDPGDSGAPADSASLDSPAPESSAPDTAAPKEAGCSCTTGASWASVWGVSVGLLLARRRRVA